MGPFRLPPGPRLPASIQGAWLAYRPYQFLERCRDAHGEAFTLATPIGRLVVFASPEAAERVFGLGEGALLGGEAQAPLVDFAGEKSLMKLDGPEHAEHRTILTRSLRPADLPEGGDALLGLIRESVARWPVGRRFDLGAELDWLAVEVAGDLCLGGLPADIGREMGRTIVRLRRASTPLGLLRSAALPGRPGPFSRVRAMLEGHVDALIGLENREGRSPCVFGRLAAGRTAPGVGLDARSIRDETLTLYMATVGGLSCSMKHSFHWALRTPEVGPRVRASTAASVARGDARGVAADPYLDSTCKEILRLCPDIPFAVRRAAVDVEVGPWRVPAGTTLGVGIYLIHRREASYPEAERFRPDRFLTARPSRFEYLPFGGGRRGCVAASLFPFVQKLILAAVFERHHLRHRGPRANPVTTLGLVSSPSRPLLASASPPPPTPRRVGPALLPAAPMAATCPFGFGAGRAPGARP